jgi:hypothetical protein
MIKNTKLLTANTFIVGFFSWKGRRRIYKIKCQIKSNLTMAKNDTNICGFASLAKSFFSSTVTKLKDKQIFLSTDLTQFKPNLTSTQIFLL